MRSERVAATGANLRRGEIASSVPNASKGPDAHIHHTSGLM